MKYFLCSRTSACKRTHIPKNVNDNQGWTLEGEIFSSTITIMCCRCNNNNNKMNGTQLFGIEILSRFI